MQIDPRTVARNIPGIFDEIFPQLTPGIVMHFNLQAETMPVRVLPKALLDASKLQRAMLFELAYSVAENLLRDEPIDWSVCFEATLERQRAYFDAKLPEQLDTPDMEVAELVGRDSIELACSACATVNIVYSDPKRRRRHLDEDAFQGYDLKGFQFNIRPQKDNAEDLPF